MDLMKAIIKLSVIMYLYSVECKQEGMNVLESVYT